jgi:hypothetical protein
MKKIIVFCLMVVSLQSCYKSEYAEPDNGGNSGGGNGCISVQCSSTATSTSVRCQRITTNCNGRCWQHQ